MPAQHAGIFFIHDRPVSSNATDIIHQCGFTKADPMTPTKQRTHLKKVSLRDESEFLSAAQEQSAEDHADEADKAIASAPWSVRAAFSALSIKRKMAALTVAS